MSFSEKMTFTRTYSEIELTDESGNKVTLLRFIFENT